MYEHILVPTDGSPGAAQALDHTIALAKVFDSTVHGLHIIEPIYTTDAGTEYVIEMLQEAGEQTIEEFKHAVELHELAVRTEMRNGPAYREIVAYADEHDIDLIVMGTHGRTGLDRYLLGSVTEKVVRLASVPVLTVRMKDNQ